MKRKRIFCKKMLSVLLCLLTVLSIIPCFSLTASAAGVVPYAFALGTYGYIEGNVFAVGNATQKEGNYFVLASSDAANGFSITFEVTTNNIYRSQYCVTSYAGVVGQYNRNAVDVIGGDDDGWTIEYPKYVFDHHTTQTVKLKSNGEVRGTRTVRIPIRDYTPGYGVENIEFLDIKVVFYDSSVSANDISRNIGWSSDYGVNGGTLEYPGDSPETAVLYANWELANNKYMSATYQWYKEQNGSFVKINGAASQTYKPDGEGKYKADISVTVQDNKLAGVPAGTYNVSATATVSKRTASIYLGIDKYNGTNVTKTLGDTYRFAGYTGVPGIFTIKKGDYEYTIISTANGSSTFFYTDYITAELAQSGTYNWTFVPTASDYQKGSSGTATLTVNPKNPEATVSIAEAVTSAEPESGRITLKAAVSGKFKITTQGITKEYTYSASDVGNNKVIPETDFFTNPTMGNAVLEYEFVPADTPDYKTVTGSINYKYTTDGVVNITQNDGGTITVDGKSDSKLILASGEYTVKVTPVATNSTTQSSVASILVNGSALSEDKLTRHSDGSVTAVITVSSGTACTVSAEFNYKKLAVKNNATVYVDAGDSLAEINKAIFDAVIDKNNTAGITASDIYTQYYQGYMPQFFDTPGHEVWATPDNIVFINYLIKDAHTFGEHSANSYKESLKITVPGTNLSASVTVTAYRRAGTYITVNSENIVIPESEYNYDNIIKAIGAKLNGSENSSLVYSLSDGTALSKGWNGKSAGDEFTVNIKFNGTTNKENSLAPSEKTVTVYIRPKIAVTPNEIEKVYTGSAVDIKTGDFTSAAAQGTGLPVAVNSVTYYDSSKTKLDNPPVNAGAYYLKLSLSDKYGSFESDFIPLNITAATNAWTTAPSISGWTYGQSANSPSAAAKFGTVKVTYVGTAFDGSSWNNTEAPKKAGNYKAVFTVDATSDYSALSKSVDFTVAKANLTVTADNASKIYGDNDPAEFTWKVTDGSVVSGDTLAVNSSRDSGENVGTYAIKVSQNDGANPNYNITFVNGLFTINKATLTVTADNCTATYGDAAPVYTVTYGGFKNGDDKEDLGGTLSFTCDYAQFSDKGEYTVTPHGYESDNYEFSYVNGILTVNPKPITVTVENKSSIYGDDIADLTAVDNGIVNNDTNVYELNTAASKTASVGKYDIIGTTLDDNYSITFANENDAYEITVRELTVTVVVADKWYDRTDSATITSAELNNVANGDEVTLVNGTATFASIMPDTNIDIIFTDFTLSGEAEVLKNYTLIQPTGVTADIKVVHSPGVNTEYTVIFNANGGSGEMQSQIIKCNISTALIANTFTMPDHHFVGWNTAKDGSGEKYTDKQTILNVAEAGESITLYAQWAPNGDATRLYGSNRYETAIAISKQGWNTADTVILASGANFPDALAGVTLSKKYDAPILLTNGTVLEEKVMTEIKRLGADSVIILGGANAVSDNIKSTLETNGYYVKRLAGENRNGTAGVIALELTAKSDIVFIVCNGKYPDALSVSSVAAIKGYPILFANADGSLPIETKDTLTALGASYAYIIGGTKAVASSVEDNLGALGIKHERIFGTDRYDTSVAIYKKFADSFSREKVSVATGTNFPDALSGSAFAAKHNMHVFLVGNNASNALCSSINGAEELYIYGGHSAVSDDILNALSVNLEAKA